MPELDRIEVSFRPGWRVPYRWARDRSAPDAQIAEKLVKALSATLRENDGIPGFEEVVALILMSAHSPNTILATFDKLDALVSRHGGHKHVMVASEVAKSIMVQVDDGRKVSDISVSLAEAVCSALIDHHFFSKALNPLIWEQRFRNHDEARAWQSDIERLMQQSIEKIARKLVTDPGADRLRAPNRMTRKEKTSDLLRQDLMAPQN